MGKRFRAKGESRNIMGRRPTTMIGFIVGALVLAGGMYFIVGDSQREQPDYVSTYTTVPPRPVAPAPVLPAAPTLLFYGGSLTAGSSTADDAMTFRGRITQAASRREPARIHVNAVSGIRTWSFLDQMRPVPAGIDLAVIELGTNDVGNTDPTAFRGGYDAVVTKIRTANPDAGLLCIGTWGPSARTKRYDYEIRESCREAGGTFVPISRFYAQSRFRGSAGASSGGQASDAFSPNQAGHEAIAGAILEVIVLD
ncbi:SGNH/GDSL hydrolase family protein [Rhodococcus rhodochrous]|uniref:SGNH/GDSL hydrolase family protein n=1 Tax=Rhodococcus rhodochrous TaxID=1829 RepID=UPI003B82E89D